MKYCIISLLAFSVRKHKSFNEFMNNWSSLSKKWKTFQRNYHWILPLFILFWLNSLYIFEAIISHFSKVKKNRFLERDFYSAFMKYIESIETSILKILQIEIKYFTLLIGISIPCKKQNSRRIREKNKKHEILD